MGGKREGREEEEEGGEGEGNEEFNGVKLNTETNRFIA